MECMVHRIFRQTAPVLKHFYHSKPLNMTPQSILSSDPLDLIFDQRNKDYGAYTLRKYYPNRIKYALVAMLTFAGVASIFSVFQSGKSNKSGKILFPVVEHVLQQLSPTPPPPPPVKPKVPPMSVAKFLSNVVIVNNPALADSLNDPTKRIIGSKNIFVPVEMIQHVDPTEPTVFVSTPSVPVVPGAQEPLENPDVQPEFPGGMKALQRFLEMNLRSPAELDADATVKVQVRFVVGYDGNLQQFEVVKDGGEVFNQEVVRVLKKMPRWNPGKMGNKQVTSYYSIPVVFTASE